MKSLLMALALFLPPSSFALDAGEDDASVCSCKCVTQESDGTLSTARASGADREAAGEALKKKLQKKKCELSPVCSGSC
jgi:hypothetical protein